MQGWVKVHSYTRPLDNILKYKQWSLDGDLRKVTEGRNHAGGMVAKLEGTDDRDAALALMGKNISVLRSALPKPKKGEVYWTDLMGCTVVSSSGAVFGVIAEVTSNGAQDVMLVKGDIERLIPWVSGQIVQSVDLKTRQVVVEWDPSW